LEAAIVNGGDFADEDGLTLVGGGDFRAADGGAGWVDEGSLDGTGLGEGERGTNQDES
jgi:hypothetical protein